MTLRIGVSEPGGTFYTQALALRKVFKEIAGLPAVTIVDSRTGASIENAIRLEAGDLDMAFVSAPWVAAAINGVPPFTRRLDLRNVAPMNLGPNFFVARADSNLHHVRDLKGRRLAIGLPTSGMTPHAEAVLGALGIGPDDIEKVYVDFVDGARLLVSGEVDAQYQRPIPNQVMTDLCRQIQVRILRFDPHEIEAAQRAVPSDRPINMKAGALPGLTDDIPQLGVLNLLVTHRRCDEDLVRRVTDAIIAHAPSLTSHLPLFKDLPDLMRSTLADGGASLEFEGVELHPGAAHAYAGFQSVRGC